MEIAVWMCSFDINNNMAFCIHMGVSKNRGIPKWMVKIMETPIKMDDLGVPLFLETPTWFFAIIGGFCWSAS